MNVVAVFVIVLFSVLLLMQFFPFLRARTIRGKEIQGVGELLAASGTSDPQRKLVYFWSPACSMCRSMTRVIDKLMEQRDDVLKIDASRSQDVAKRLHVMATPTIVLVNGEKVEDVLVGARTERQIKALLT